MDEHARLQNIINLNEITVDFNSSEPIREEGIYYLSSNKDSFFVLIPNYLTKAEVQTFLNNTQQNLNFEYKSHLNGNHEKRQTEYFGPKYSYGDIQQGPNHTWNVDLLRMKAQLEINYGIPLNSVLINKYMKDDYIPAHKDNEKCLRDDPFIFSVSFGETGRLKVEDDKNSQKNIEVILKSGSLLIMGGGFNRNYKHSVVKSNNNKVRLNCTFRYIYEDIPSINEFNTQINSDL